MNTQNVPTPSQPADPQAPALCPDPCAPSAPQPVAQPSDPLVHHSPINHDPPSIPAAPSRTDAPRSDVPRSGEPTQTLRERLRKIRSDAKLLNLPADQREELINWLLDGMPYGDARILVEAEFGIQVRCLTRFSEFWYRFCAPRLLEERKQLVGAAKTHAALAREDCETLDHASFDAIRQRAYIMATAPNSSLQEMNLALAMVAQIRQLEDARQRLELERARMLGRPSAQPPLSSTPPTSAPTAPASQAPKPATTSARLAPKASSAHPHHQSAKRSLRAPCQPASPRPAAKPGARPSASTR